MSLHYRTTVLAEGGGTGLGVPSDIVEALGHGKRPKVVVTIGPHTWRSTVATYGPDSYLPLSAVNRTAAGVAAGDDVEVVLELDEAPREVEIPADLAAALETRPGAREAFDRLSFTRRSDIVSGILDAKRDETRLRRIEKAVAELG